MLLTLSLKRAFKIACSIALVSGLAGSVATCSLMTPAHADPLGFDSYFGPNVGTAPWRGPNRWEGLPGVGCRVTHFTSAQLLALNTTPITIFTAPGANKAYVVIYDNVTVVYNSSAYTDSGANGLYYGTSAGLEASTGIHLAALLTASTLKPGVLTQTGTTTQMVNQPIVATGTANMAAGNSPMIEETCVVVVPTT